MAGRTSLKHGNAPGSATEIALLKHKLQNDEPIDTINNLSITNNKRKSNK